MLEDFAKVADIYTAFSPEIIIHLAAQAGVRYSLENPRAYVDANLVGTFNLLELARAGPQAFTDCLHQLGLWRQYQDALC